MTPSTAESAWPHGRRWLLVLATGAASVWLGLVIFAFGALALSPLEDPVLRRADSVPGVLAVEGIVFAPWGGGVLLAIVLFVGIILRIRHPRPIATPDPDSVVPTGGGET